MALFPFSRNIGIDLGTHKTRVYVPYSGIVFNEPSILALDKNKNVMCVGKSAYEMSGRAPEDIEIHKTIFRGIIQDEELAEKYLNFIFKRMRGVMRFFKNDVLVGIPTNATGMEQRAIIHTCKLAGARNVCVGINSILSAYGIGMHADELRGRMVTSIGAGLTESAVISLGGMSSHSSIKIGGDDMDVSIVEHVRQKYHLNISVDAARIAKESIGHIEILKVPKETKVKGNDVTSKLPRIVKINSNDISRAIASDIKKILENIANVFQNTPPELTSDIIEKGIVLTGGSSNLNDIAITVERYINTPVRIADDPESATIRGIGKSIQTGHVDFHKKSLLLK